jgi:nicotinamidase-related amidase
VPRTALIVIDMLSAYEHDDAEQLTDSVEHALPAMERLSDKDALLRSALEGKFRHLVEPIAPHEQALFVVKARHSIFYQTPLEYLLGQEDVDRVVMIGQVTEQCILYSALDAYIRHFEVAVPRDAVAHIHEHLADAALELMERNMSADITTADEVAL